MLEKRSEKKKEMCVKGTQPQADPVQTKEGSAMRLSKKERKSGGKGKKRGKGVGKTKAFWGKEKKKKRQTPWKQKDCGHKERGTVKKGG